MAAYIYGYPKRLAPGGSLALTDFNGKILGFGQRVNCAKVRPGARGSWISSEWCSYRFKVGGQWYACRGAGEGMSASCRAMKPVSVKRVHLSGARGRRR